MKKYKFLLSCLVAVCFTACIQIEEEVEIKADGSGSVAAKTEMGQLFEMLKGFASPEDLQKDGLDKAMDTTILMKDIVDTVQELSAENKALLRNGKMQLQMNMKENLFNINMNFPFNSIADANKLTKAMNEMDVMGKSLKNLGGGQQPGPDQPAQIPTSGGGIEKINSMYDVSFSNGEYKKILNRARYDSLVNDPKLQESKGMLSMMGDMSLNLTVKVPKPIKSVSNPRAVITADKKSVSLKGDIIAAIDSPQLMEIIIRY